MNKFQPLEMLAGLDLVLLFPFAFILAGFLTYYLTPRIRELAIRLGIMDKPDGKLKTQPQPVPYLGGLVIYIAFLIALSIVYEFRQEVLGLLLAGTVVAVWGLLDDLGAFLPRTKLLGQILAVFVLVKSGIYIQLTIVPVYLAIPLTFFWVLAIINAFNIIDVMDGLAAGVALVTSLALFFVAVINGNMTIAVLTLVLAGSLSGFIPFNFQPARIYLGDTGSMFLGLMLGALSLVGDYTDKNLLGFLVPVVILGIPLFDMALVVWVRMRKGISPFRGSPDHYALRLRKAGFSVPQIVGFSYLVSGVLGILGILLMWVEFLPALVILSIVGLIFLVVFFWVQRIPD